MYKYNLNLNFFYTSDIKYNINNIVLNVMIEIYYKIYNII